MVKFIVLLALVAGLVAAEQDPKPEASIRQSGRGNGYSFDCTLNGPEPETDYYVSFWTEYTENHVLAKGEQPMSMIGWYHVVPKTRADFTYAPLVQDPSQFSEGIAQYPAFTVESNQPPKADTKHFCKVVPGTGGNVYDSNRA